MIPEGITNLSGLSATPLLLPSSKTEPTSDQFGMFVEVDTCDTNPRNHTWVLGSDRMLYKRYALTKTEIKLIESKIRPMEAKDE